MTDPTYPVIEIFGPTIAGEGNIAGALTTFIRLGYCDYRCAWCDSMHAVDPDTVNRTATWMTATEIANHLENRRSPILSISGGNPAVHKHLNHLITELKQRQWRINVETQGSIWQEWLTDCDVITVSPKPPSSQMQDRLNHTTLNRILQLPHAILKIVTFNDEDLNWANTIATNHPNTNLYISIGTHQTDTHATLLQRYKTISETILKQPNTQLAKATILPQLHVLMWGHMQGV